MLEFFDYTNFNSSIVVGVILLSFIVILRFLSTIFDIIISEIYDSFNILKLVLSSLIIIFFLFILSFNLQDKTYHQRKTTPGTSLLDIKIKE